MTTVMKIFNIKVVERGEGGDSRGPEKIVIPAVFQVFTFKTIQDF